MPRFLFVVPPLTGHVNPTVSVGRVLADRGHEVAWVGHPGKVRPLLPEMARLFELDDRVPAQMLGNMTSRPNRARGVASLKFLWEDFLIPLARDMRPGVDEAVEAFGPDVLIVDQQAVAGAMVARQRGLAWATCATTSAAVTDPLAALGLPKVKRWFDDQLAGLEREAGLPQVDHPDRSDQLVIVFSTETLVGPADPFPDHYLFVGPSISARSERTPFPWDALEDRPRVLVSLGTLNAEHGERFYRAVVEALGGSPIQVILVAPAGLVGEIPQNILRRDFVPQLELLPRVNAVVCHGGHNTVCEALAHGLPLVVAPIKHDQPVVAGQVVAAGAGLRLKFGRVRAEDLRTAVERVLHEPAFGAAAKRVQASFERAGGATRAADALEQLA